MELQLKCDSIFVVGATFIVYEVVIYKLRQVSSCVGHLQVTTILNTKEGIICDTEFCAL
jgi:hypothetical protein